MSPVFAATFLQNPVPPSAHRTRPSAPACCLSSVNRPNVSPRMPEGSAGNLLPGTTADSKPLDRNHALHILTYRDWRAVPDIAPRLPGCPPTNNSRRDSFQYLRQKLTNRDWRLRWHCPPARLPDANQLPGFHLPRLLDRAAHYANLRQSPYCCLDNA